MFLYTCQSNHKTCDRPCPSIDNVTLLVLPTWLCLQCVTCSNKFISLNVKHFQFLSALFDFKFMNLNFLEHIQKFNTTRTMLNYSEPKETFHVWDPYALPIEDCEIQI